MKRLTSLAVTAALLGGTVLGWAASTPTLLLHDNFNANTANTRDLNIDLARQTGTLAPLAYTLGGGTGGNHQLQNVGAPDQLLLAGTAAAISPNFNFNGASSDGGLKISFDLDSKPLIYTTGTAQDWGCINFGMAQANQLVVVNNAAEHFGILFRAAGTIQAFNGNAVVSATPEPVYTTNPRGVTNHIELYFTDVDGNPFDGVGNTRVDVFVNGGTTAVFSYTKVGGFANNYINLQANAVAHFDNLQITQLANVPPTIANPSFEADSFTVFPGYVSGNGPITGWTALGGHGVNPGSFGGPFTDNGIIPDGTKAAFMQDDGPMSQLLSGFNIGSTYQIRYFENARNGGSPGSEVKIGGATIVAPHVVTPVGGANPYREIISDPFVATAPSMELAFIKSNPQGGDTTLLIDNVSIIAPGTPPSIIEQPADTIVALGDTATLTVRAAGSAPLAYQWYFGTDPVFNGNGSSLSILSDFPDVAGMYYVIVSNSSGSITSRVATLTVRAKVPGIFNSGVDDSGVALADGAVDPHYQLIVNADGPSTEALVHSSTIFPIVAGPWLANSASSKWISPRLDSSLAAGLATGGGIYVYRTTFDLTGLDKDSVIISGGWAVDNVGLSIKVNDQPTGAVNNNGFAGPTTFTLTAANSAFVDGVNTLDFEVRNDDAVAGYTALRLVNMRGTAQLPGTPPNIEEQPVGGLAGTGESVTFSVVASGSSPLSYQWFRGANEIPGANGPSYTIASVQKSDADSYTVRVTNPSGEATSNPAVLTVRDSIPGIFNTGVDGSRNALLDGEVDPHYQIVVNPDGASPDAIVENSAAFPIVAGPWVANTAGSKWIGPRLDTSAAAGAVGVGGDYTYRTIVDLAGFDPATVVITGRWATDNDGVDIFVNGVATGQRNTVQFTALTPFTLNSGFVAGLNVIEFKVNNSAVGYTGLYIDQMRGLGDALPAGTLPFIVTQPQDVSTVILQTAEFSVRANGSAPLSYQWYFGPDPIPGETRPTLSVLVEFPDVAGEYSVEVSNPFGSIRSQPANLVVLAEPVILAQPQSRTVAIGDSVIFTVSAIGEPPLSYQWTKDGAPIPGANDTSYSIASVATGDAGAYAVQVSNFNDTTVSDDAILSIAELVPGVFNTGVDATGAPLADGAVDPHYRLITNPDSASADALVQNSAAFPIVAGPWVANGPNYKWIGPRFDTTSAAGGDYAYEVTFNLSGFDLATVVVSGEWSTDNAGTDVLLNGVSTGNANPGGFNVYSPFTLTTGLLPGINKLEFRLNNAGAGYTGLQVRNLRAIGVRGGANQAPAFVKGPDVTVAEDSGPASIANWATEISAGAGEAGQALTFLVESDNASLFAAGPAVDATTGTLTFTPAANANGQANVTVTLMDDGGTANGGVDTSAPQTFVIAVTPVNDCPTAAGQTVSLNEDTATAIALSGSDADGDALTYAIATAPAHGTLTGTAPDLTYTPAPNYCGADSFTYTVDDGICIPTVVTVSLAIACVNDAPVAAFEISPLFAADGLDYPTVISANGSNACVVLDGSLTTDVEGDEIEYAWLLDGSLVPVASGVIATACIELGIHEITLVATDSGGASGTATRQVEVITAAEALDLLIAQVNGADIERKNKRPFLATLKAAQASFDRGNVISAVNQLGAFQNKVRAQIGRNNPEEAAKWIRLAQAIVLAVESAPQP